MLISVNIAPAQDAAWGRTALPKVPVTGRVPITETGVEGDGHVDSDHSGVYYECSAYAREDLDWWSESLGRDLPNGSFGENFTVEGLPIRELLLGQYCRIGTVRFEVMGPSLPGPGLAAALAVPDLLQRYAEAGRPGVALRPVVWSGGGDMAAGDLIEILWTPIEQISIAEAWQACLGDTEVLERILAFPGRSQLWELIAEQAREPAGAH